MDNLGPENIVFVSHEGDLVDDGDSRTQYERMGKVMSTLDGEVPYATPPGDHDWFEQEDRSTSTEYYRESSVDHATRAAVGSADQHRMT
ncbi:metallophosphoesterase family protein [Halalkalicoccus salilacus]|uniref:hypothetical protein n=1 Tax=Halalkalicoccus salilacus TaxID=3117459 RepID=UPI00300F1137